MTVSLVLSYYWHRPMLHRKKLSNFIAPLCLSAACSLTRPICFDSHQLISSHEFLLPMIHLPPKSSDSEWQTETLSNHSSKWHHWSNTLSLILELLCQLYLFYMIWYLLFLSQPPVFTLMRSQEGGQSYHPLKWVDSLKQLQQMAAIYQENISCQEKQMQIISLLTVLFITAAQLSCWFSQLDAVVFYLAYVIESDARITWVNWNWFHQQCMSVPITHVPSFPLLPLSTAMFSRPAAVDILFDSSFSHWEMTLPLNSSVPWEGTLFVNIFNKNDQNNSDLTDLECCDFIRSGCITLALSFRLLYLYSHKTEH